LKVLKGFPGIAKIHFDLDALGNKRGGTFGLRNGKAPADPLVVPHPGRTQGRAGLKPIIIKAILKRSCTRGELQELAVSGNYKLSSLSQQINHLRHEGIVEHDKLGNWSLTKEARAKFEAVDGEAQERRALPPPPSEKRTRSSGAPARTALLDMLRAETKPLTRLELRHKMVEQGFTSGTFDGALFRHQKDRYVTKGANGFKITAAGRKAKMPGVPPQPTEE
jgi:hypothetical protein